MKWPILIFMALGLLVSAAYAQSLFEYDRVDFFKGVDTQEKVKEIVSKEDPETIVSEWAEPIISPSGKVTIYVPPKEVKDFLEKPDPENAKAYLEWNLKRIKKFILAQELLAKEAKDLHLMEDDKPLSLDGFSSSDGTLITDAGLKGDTLFYFVLKGCPACQEETKIIEDIYLTHPGIKIEAFASGFSDKELQEFIFPIRQDNGVSQYFKINSYPTILVFNKKKEKYFISGYVDKNKILGLF